MVGSSVQIKTQNASQNPSQSALQNASQSPSQQAALNQTTAHESKGDNASGNPLRAIRRQSYLTQEEVAQRLGVSQRRVSQIEHAEIDALKIGTLDRYVKAVGGSLRILITQDR